MVTEIDAIDRVGLDIWAEVPLVEDPRDPPSDTQNTIRRAVEEALSWRRENIDPKIEKATKYYNGEPFGDERPGRSKVVDTTVRDVVQMVLPSVLRVFFGSENTVEFKPRRPEASPVAEQQTDYVNLIVREDNTGFNEFYAAFKDAFVRKLGIITWWWEKDTKTETSVHSGLSEEDILSLQTDESVTVDFGEPDENGFFEATVTRAETYGCAKIAAIPPEEFVWSPSARSLQDARLVGRVREVPADELVAMGIDREIVDRNRGRSPAGYGEEVDSARRIDRGSWDGREDTQDPSTRPVLFADLYMKLDLDGDGVSELVHVQTVGDSYEVVFSEPADEKPFALFCPDPEPHTLIGLSTADYVMDLQRISSAVMRGMLDSLSLTLNPATEVVETMVNMKDVLNTEVGRIIRTRAPGQMREVTTPFVGREALPVLQWLYEVRENRTGISKAAAGLDADALQSTTKAAVAATMSAAQQRVEMIARIFAENGMKTLFRGLLKLVVRNQDKPRVVRLRGKYVEVDPRHWDADLDVVVNVALGAGTPEDKIVALSAIAQKQELLLEHGAPIVGLAEYRSTLGKMTELAGFPDSEVFFRPWTSEQDAQMEQAKAQEPPKPDPTEALMQVEMAKIQAQTQMKQAELALKAEELRLTDERERYRITTDAAIKKAAIEARFETDVESTRVKREKLELDAVSKGAEVGLKMADLTGIAVPEENPYIDAEAM